MRHVIVNIVSLNGETISKVHKEDGGGGGEGGRTGISAVRVKCSVYSY